MCARAAPCFARVAFAIGCASGPATAAPATDDPPAPPPTEGFLERAREAQLSARSDWRALLHYRRGGPLRKPRSLIDEPSFFLAPAGARDPVAELEATLRAFLQSDPEAAQTAACRFPARFAWLDRELGLSDAIGADPDCAEYRAWRANFEASRLTLVFAEAYMNNPASMFGHTLLRIDSADATDRSDLLAYAVNFAAHTSGEDGLSYAAKGIFGFYPGYFSVAPYYTTVERYGDWENRDIWEYELDYDADEIERVLRHLYELDKVRFDYYFFDENCSYQILDLIEVGRPGTGLIQSDLFWLIPVDSVRQVREAGLVRGVRFRASAASRLRAEAAGQSRSRQRLARSLSRGRIEPRGAALEELSGQARAEVLSLAYDDLRYRMIAGQEDPDGSRGRALALLTARSAERGAPPREPLRPDVEPDRGHPTRRAALESGYWNREPYVELRLRPAFHDLTDPVGGYTRGAAIQFLDTAIRILPERNRVRLQEVRVLDIDSLTPRDALFRPVSWRVQTGLATRLVPHDDDLRAASVWRNRGGVGGTWEWGFAQIYGMAEALFEVGGRLDHDVALGPGWSLGASVSVPGDRWRGELFFSGEQILVGETGRAMRVGVRHRARLGRRNALSLEGRWEDRFHEGRFELALRWSHYF